MKCSPPRLPTHRRDVYLQPDAADPVLPAEHVLALVQRHVPNARAVTAIDESGGEARTYAVDATIILKTQRPHRLRPRTSLAKEVLYLHQLAAKPDIRVPRVLGYGNEEIGIEYICMTRVPGIAVANAPLSATARHAALADLGRMLRRIHALPREPFEQSDLFPGDHSPDEVRARLADLVHEVVARLGIGAPLWTLPLTPEELAEHMLSRLPDTDVRVALHSNPGPPHTFVDPATGALTGLIDFGDSYISHPALDLWRWHDPADRIALFQGYTAEQPVDAAFLQTWNMVQAMADLQAIASMPLFAPAAQAHLQQLVAGSAG